MSTLRLNAGSVLDGSTSGYSEPNRVTVTAMIAPAVPTNAHPSRPQPVRDERGDQRAGRGEHREQRPAGTVGELGPEQEPAARRARWRADPAPPGRPARAPHVPGGLERQEHRAVQGEQQQRGQPAEQRVGVEQGEQGAGVLVARRRAGRRPRCWRTPRPRAGPAASEPNDDRDGPSGAATRRCRSCRGTRRRPRARSARPGSAAAPGRSRRTGVAYHSGKAAKVAPPATSSHTSLPSQTGPMVLITTRRSVSVAAEDRQQHADAEVEALQDEVAGPQHGDEQEPDVGAVPSRGSVSVGEGERPRARCRPDSGSAGVGRRGPALA